MTKDSDVVRGRRDVRGVTLAELEELYRLRGSDFERVAIALTGDEGLGCDAVQEAFVRAVRGRARFHGNGPVGAWVWRIVVNEAHRRREARRIEDALPDELGTTPESDRPETADVRSLIAELPERQRLVLFLRYYADLDYAAIAEVLAISPGTVAATLHSAHARLDHDLQEVREWRM
jgi:RNA polymerase sigma-70 factor, ECF subfamily